MKEPTIDFERLDGSTLLGGPVFRNPFPETDPRCSIIAPYFKAMAEFRRLAVEYPKLSIRWKAFYPMWSPWPPSKKFAGASKRIPSAPGAELNLERSASQAAEQLLGFSGDALPIRVRIWLNPARDRWLNTKDLKPWEFWLYAIREFWLKEGEEAQASNGNVRVFEKTAENQGYLPGHSTPIGQRVWSKMVAGRISLQGAMKEIGLSTGQEIGPHEDPAAWIHDGIINHAFKSFVYFCGVLAAQRLTELKNPEFISPGSDPVSYQQAPAFLYHYPDDFPASGQLVIEHARLDANRQLERKESRSYEEHIAARVDWFWDLISVVASALGKIEINEQWSIKRRRDMLSDFGLRAAAGVGLPNRRLQKLIDSERWSTLNECLIPAPRIINQGGVVSSDGPVRHKKRPNTVRPDKRNTELLQGPDGKQKILVNLDVAARFGGVSKRAIEKAIQKRRLISRGTSVNRRVVVSSLLEYFPPEK